MNPLRVAIVDDELLARSRVRRLLQRVGGSDFVVVFFDSDAHFRKNREHFGTDVLGAVDRRNREVAALRARTMAEIA